MSPDRTPASPATICGVTGAGGYVGSRLVRSLRADGMQVAEFRSDPAPGQANLRRFELKEPPEPALFRGIDLLVHCAYDFKALGWDEIRSINIDGTRRLFESAARGGVRRFLLVSSVSAFPGCRSLYGRAKLETEAIGAHFGAIIIRPGLVFGPNPGGMLRALDRLAAFPFAIPMLGAGDAVQYVAHEDDFGRLVSLAATQPARFGQAPLVAAHPRAYSLREIMTALSNARRRKPRFIAIPSGFIAAGLFLAESSGLRLRIRRDNLVSLLHQNPAPDFAALEHLGINFRPFSAPGFPE